MIQHYLKFFFRQARKHAYFHLLISLGVVSAIATAIFIYAYSRFEYSYDQQHERLDDLYRVHFTIRKGNNPESVNAGSTPVIGPLLYRELSGVESFTRLYPRSGSTIQVADNQDEWSHYPEDKIYHADSAFFQLFDFPVIRGNQQEILKEPFTAVVSESFARIAFGSIDNAIGSTFYLTDEETYLVQGVYKDLPINTHMQAEVLLSFSTLHMLDWTRESITSDWGWYSFFNFVLLKKDRNVSTIDQEILAITEPHTRSIDERINGRLTYTLYPVKDIYLESDLSGEMDQKGNGFMVRSLTLIAVLILVLAFINYVSLSSSISLNRTKESALRKTIGGSPQSLRLSFVLESLLHLVVFLMMAIALVVLSWKAFASIIGKQIPFDLILTPEFMGITVLILVGVALMSGTYNYTMANRLLIVTALKDANANSKSSSLFRKSILFIQYIAGVSLLILSLVVHDQVKLLINGDPGFETKDTIAIKLRRTRGDQGYFRKINTFSQSLKELPGAMQVSLSSHIPAEEVSWTSGGKIVGQNSTTKFVNLAIDEGFLDLYDISLIGGSGFTDNRHQNSRAVIINETAMSALGYQDPEDIINKTYLYAGNEAHPYRIIGVVRDFYQRGLKYGLDPMVFHYLPNHAIYTGSAYASIKISSMASFISIREAFEQKWNQHFPGHQIEYSDVDAWYIKQYEGDQKAMTLLTYFTTIAILIAALGLIGLVVFTAKQRTREIGIRKVLGATTGQIIAFIGQAFIRLMLAGMLVAWVISYFMVDLWLENYPARITVDFVTYFISGFGLLTLSVLLVASFSYTSASRSPIQSIRMD